MSYAPVPRQTGLSDRPPPPPSHWDRLSVQLAEFKRHLDQRPEQAFVLVFVLVFVLGTGSFVLYMVTGDFDDAGGALDNDSWVEEARRFEAYLKPVLDRLDNITARLDRIEGKLGL